VTFEPRHPLAVRIYKPELRSDGGWRCRVQIDSPIEIDPYALGRSSLEALWRGLCIVGRGLYGHPLWRAGRLGNFDEGGGYLGLPAPTSLTLLAPHPY
jgi:hypothetical protein